MNEMKFIQLSLSLEPHYVSNDLFGPYKVFALVCKNVCVHVLIV